jgi:hypothetical protein
MGRIMGKKWEDIKQFVRKDIKSENSIIGPAVAAFIIMQIIHGVVWYGVNKNEPKLEKNLCGEFREQKSEINSTYNTKKDSLKNWYQARIDSLNKVYLTQKDSLENLTY